MMDLMLLLPHDKHLGFCSANPYRKKLEIAPEKMMWYMISTVFNVLKNKNLPTHGEPLQRSKPSEILALRGEVDTAPIPNPAAVSYAQVVTNDKLVFTNRISLGI